MQSRNTLTDAELDIVIVATENYPPGNGCFWCCADKQCGKLDIFPRLADGRISFDKC